MAMEDVYKFFILLITDPLLIRMELEDVMMARDTYSHLVRTTFLR